MEQATKETAKLFETIVQDMEQHTDDPELLARYLNQIMFCLYAEDAGLTAREDFHSQSPLLRPRPRHLRSGGRIAIAFVRDMSMTAGWFGADRISYFNGDLFNQVRNRRVPPARP